MDAVAERRQVFLDACFDFDETKHPRDAKGRFGDGDGMDIEYDKQLNDATGGKIGLRELKAALLKDTPPGTDVSIETQLTDMGISISGSYIAPDGHDLGNFSRELWTDPRFASARMESFVLEESAQGQGIGTAHYAAFAELAQAAGCDRMDLTANISVGGYAWAKFGFVPNASDLTYALETKVGTAEKNPWTMSADATNTGRVAVDALHAADKAAGKNDDVPATKVRDITAKILDSPGGKELLLGTEWGGTLDMTDRKSMDRFNQYAGTNLPTMPARDHEYGKLAASGGPGPHNKLLAEPVDRSGRDAWIWQEMGIDAALTASGDFDEAKHPRDTHGRFGEGDGTLKERVTARAAVLAPKIFAIDRRLTNDHGWGWDHPVKEDLSNAYIRMSRLADPESSAGQLFQAQQAAYAIAGARNAIEKMSDDELPEGPRTEISAQLLDIYHETRGFADELETHENDRRTGEPDKVSGPSDATGTASERYASALAAADQATQNGPWTPEIERQALAARSDVVAAGGSGLVDTLERWQGGYFQEIAGGAQEIVVGRQFPNYEDNHDYRPEARELLTAVNVAPPIDGSLSRGLLLGPAAVPKAGDLIDEPLSSWSRNPAVASSIMDMRLQGQESSVRVMLQVDNPKAVATAALSDLTGDHYRNPALVTSQEYLSGGQFKVDHVEQTTMPHGGEDPATHEWKFGVSGTSMWTENTPPNPAEHVPVTVVHVTQSATYNRLGEVVAR